MRKRYKLIIILLVITNITSVMVLVIKSKLDDPHNNPYPYIDFSRNYIEQKNFIVNTQPLRDKLQTIYDKYGGTDKIAVYVEFLNTGANIAYNPDSRFYPASLIKLPYVIATVKKIEEGGWRWDQEFTMYAEDVDVAFGTLSDKPIGSKFTIENLIKEILYNSDNTAYRILQRNLGQDAVNKFLTSTGLNSFFDKDQNVNAKEYTRLIRSLYTASYLSKDNSEKILEMMGQSKKNYAGQDIPDDVVYAHKFGENIPKGIYLDSGVVYLKDRPYIITVIFKADNKDNEDVINAFFKEIGQTVYNYFKDYNDLN